MHFAEAEQERECQGRRRRESDTQMSLQEVLRRTRKERDDFSTNHTRKMEAKVRARGEMRDMDKQSAQDFIEASATVFAR